jgi:hypothetical protein
MIFIFSYSRLLSPRATPRPLPSVHSLYLEQTAVLYPMLKCLSCNPVSMTHVRVLCIRGYSPILWTEFNYFWHCTSRIYPEAITKVLISCFCFVVSYCCHRHTHTQTPHFVSQITFLKVCYLTMLSVAKLIECCWRMNELRICSGSGVILTTEKPKYLAKTACQCHFVRHKFHMDWPAIEPLSLRCKAGELNALTKARIHVTDVKL